MIISAGLTAFLIIIGSAGVGCSIGSFVILALMWDKWHK